MRISCNTAVTLYICLSDTRRYCASTTERASIHHRMTAHQLQFFHVKYLGFTTNRDVINTLRGSKICDSRSILYYRLKRYKTKHLAWPAVNSKQRSGGTSLPIIPFSLYCQLLLFPSSFLLILSPPYSYLHFPPICFHVSTFLSCITTPF